MSTTHTQLKRNPELGRQEKLGSILNSNRLDSLVLNASPSLTYLTGLHFHISERPVVVIFRPGATPKIVLPQLEIEKLKELPYKVEAFPYGDDPSTWGNIFKEAVHSAGLSGKRNGVEPRQLRLLEYNLLLEGAAATDFFPADECVGELRMYKDEFEVDAMRKAAQIAEQALVATLPSIKIGISEKELAAELTMQLFRAGCDPQVPFSPIVSGGPNSANPHATPSERQLMQGDLLVIDWGAGYNGYFSDITRTFAIGEVEMEFSNIGNIVLEANAAGRAAAMPGLPISSVDQAARSVIEAAGYGKYFTHRTGHGLGMEGHEEPYVRAENEMLQKPGMAFTVEPGIYLPGRNGVRIEDDVVITETGCEVLTSLPREVTRLV